jgi:ATP-binding cassette, subfamily B, bacterial PglK
MNMWAALWGILSRRQQRQLLALQVVSVLMALSTAGGIAAIVPFLSVLANPSSILQHAALHALYQHLAFSNERSFVTALGAAFTALVVLANVINMFGSMAMVRFSFRVGEDLQISLFEEYLRRDYMFHARINGSLLASRILHETGRISGGLLQNGLVLITNLVTITFILASILLINPAFVGAALAVLGCSYAGIYALSRHKLLRNGELESQHYARRIKIVAESFTAVREIMVLNAYDFFVRKFARACGPISTSMISTNAIAQNPRYVLEITTVCGLVASALLLSEGAGGSSWIAPLSFIGFAAYRLLPAVQQAFFALVKIRADRPGFESISADLHHARARNCVPMPQIPSWTTQPERLIRLTGVGVRYAPTQQAAIAEVSLSIAAGSTVGLIGANGSGKTTLIDVIAGFLPAQSGQVEIDGVALNEANRAAWRASLSYVPQEIVMLDATLAENIAFGVPRASIDIPRLESAVRRARLEECVARLPLGFDEILGERGSRLSGGQRQRLGIARALYRGASLLILDEATSSLDGAAERDIMDMLASLGERHTVVLVAHRLQSLRHCGVIFELDHGRIVRSGSYEQFQRAHLARAMG